MRRPACSCTSVTAASAWLTVAGPGLARSPGGLGFFRQLGEVPGPGPQARARSSGRPRPARPCSVLWRRSRCTAKRSVQLPAPAPAGRDGAADGAGAVEDHSVAGPVREDEVVPGAPGRVRCRVGGSRARRRPCRRLVSAGAEEGRAGFCTVETLNGPASVRTRMKRSRKPEPGNCIAGRPLLAANDFAVLGHPQAVPASVSRRSRAEHRAHSRTVLLPAAGAGSAAERQEDMGISRSPSPISSRNWRRRGRAPKPASPLAREAAGRGGS